MPSLPFSLDRLLLLLPPLGGVIAVLLGLCASIIYLYKTRKRPAAGGMMVAGLLIGMLMTVGHLFWPVFMFGGSGHTSGNIHRLFLLISGMMDASGLFLFFIGLLLMALRTPVQDIDP